MKLSIIVPCYNEAESIPELVKRFAGIITRDDVEVILVNNGSSDTSKDVIANLLPKHPFLRTVFVPVNQGYGYGILQGLRSATGDYVGWTHADLQTDPLDVMKTLDIIESHDSPIMVKGKRQGRSLFDIVFTAGMSVFETFLLGERLQDINAQPNVFPREFYLTWKSPPKDFSLDLYALYLARREKLPIIRFKVQFPKRAHGKSHWNTGIAAKIKFIKRTINFSFRLKKEIIQ